MTEFITRCCYAESSFEVIIKTDSEEHYKAAENFARHLIDHAKPVTDNNVGGNMMPIRREVNTDESEKLRNVLKEAARDAFKIAASRSPREYGNVWALLADELVARGITVPKSHCPFCCNDGQEHGRLYGSYDDEDGMEMSIHPSPVLEDGYQSKAWWATVYFRGECRDFYIEVCPFCGRRLVSFKAEYETAGH